MFNSEYCKAKKTSLCLYLKLSMGRKDEIMYISPDCLNQLTIHIVHVNPFSVVELDDKKRPRNRSRSKNEITSQQLSLQ